MSLGKDKVLANPTLRNWSSAVPRFWKDYDNPCFSVIMFLDQDSDAIPRLILCFLLPYVLQESRDQLLACCLAYKAFSKYLLHGWNYRQNNEGIHHFAHCLEPFVGSTMVLCSSAPDNGLIRAKLKSVGWQNVAQLSFTRHTPEKQPFNQATQEWVGYRDPLSGSYSDCRGEERGTSCSQDASICLEKEHWHPEVERTGRTNKSIHARQAQHQSGIFLSKHNDQDSRPLLEPDNTVVWSSPGGPELSEQIKVTFTISPLPVCGLKVRWKGQEGAGEGRS